MAQAKRVQQFGEPDGAPRWLYHHLWWGDQELFPALGVIQAVSLRGIRYAVACDNRHLVAVRCPSVVETELQMDEELLRRYLMCRARARNVRLATLKKWAGVVPRSVESFSNRRIEPVTLAGVIVNRRLLAYALKHCTGDIVQVRGCVKQGCVRISGRGWSVVVKQLHDETAKETFDRWL
jgi:hypothetical protein